MVNFTVHAMKRFMLRHEKAGLGKLSIEQANQKMLNLLKNAKIVKKEDTFFQNNTEKIIQGWKFVLNFDGTILLTVERLHKSQN